MDDQRRSRIDTIVVGASAGGVEALSRLVASLPADLGAAVFVVIHFPEGAPSVLPEILGRKGVLPALHAEDGMVVVPNRIYVAPPGRHMLLKRTTIRVIDGPKENNNRPSIDPLFRTAARSCGHSVAGILLSGMLDDGTMGMASVKRYGGITIAQHPADAAFGDMPRNAIVQVGVDHVLTLDEIGPLLVRLAQESPQGASVPFVGEKDPTEMNPQELAMLERRGGPSVFTCPECHGTLFELEEDGLSHYRCRVGHAYSIETLASEQRTMLEAALWTALRSIEENNNLVERLIQRAEGQGFEVSAEHYRVRLRDGQERAKLLRYVLEGRSISLPIESPDRSEFE